MARMNLIGKVFTRLEVVSETRVKGKRGWICKCQCGRLVTIPTSNLTSGTTRSCGCLKQESTRINGKKKRGIHWAYGGIPHFASEKEALLFFYDIRKDGKIYYRHSGREVVASKDGKGYLRVRLFNPQYSKNVDNRKTYKVHRIIAMAYLDDYSNNLQVNHKNGDKEDNNIENLEMVSNRENAIHGWTLEKQGKERRRKLRAIAITKNPYYYLQIDDDGKLVNRFDNLFEAEESTGIKKSNIRSSIDNNVRAGGFRWAKVLKKSLL